jgi:hypothetical protein
LSGAATFFPFHNRNYNNASIEKSQYIFNYDDSIDSSPLAFLSGSYQYGGHRYVASNILWPQDCSSAVGVSIGLSNEQVKNINTSTIKAAYKAPNYGYQPITSSDKDLQESLDFTKIQQGDTYVRASHAAIVLSSDHLGNINTLQFNRNIGADQEKQTEGGGTFEYNLLDLLQQEHPIYFLRSSEPFKETASFADITAMIDAKYCKLYEDHEEQPVIGDWQDFWLP